MNTRSYIEPPALRRVLSYGKKGDDVKELQELLQAQGFFKGVPRGNFLELTKDSVQYFQGTHIDRDGRFLTPDGVVGPKTWWSIHNPSGSAQRSFVDVPESGKMGSDPRHMVIAFLYDLYQKPTLEVPDGSNWGDGVEKIIKECGLSFPIAWCLALQSYADKMTFGSGPLGGMPVHCSTFWNDAVKWGRAFRKDSYLPIPGDIGIYNYGNPNKKRLAGPGHAVRVVGVDKGGKAFNAIEGNAGNRVKHSLRRVSEKSLVGFVNLFEDENNPPNFKPSLIHGKTTELSLADSR